MFKKIFVGLIFAGLLLGVLFPMLVSAKGDVPVAAAFAAIGGIGFGLCHLLDKKRKEKS